MSKKPPENLIDWKKGELVREVERLRAVLHEHSKTRTATDPTLHSQPGRVVDVAQDPNAHSGVILDVRGSVLLESVDVSLIDTKYEDAEPITFMALGGRVNMSESRAEHAYIFDADGAAGLACELIGLAERSLGHEKTMPFGVSFAHAFNRRRGE